MYLNSSSKSYKKKYFKYKNKYLILKSKLGGVESTLLNGGECTLLPNSEEEDVNATNLLDLCPGERITIQNKCYEVRGLYRWIITDNHNRLPDTQTFITLEEKQRLIQAYKELPIELQNILEVENILTRDKLHEIIPGLLGETVISLNGRGYTGIAPGTFNGLRNLEVLLLQNNKIKELPYGIFYNLPELQIINLINNPIIGLRPNSYYGLPTRIEITI
jgi:hypothetical protein